MKPRYDTIGQSGRQAKRMEKQRKAKERVCRLVVKVEAVMHK